MCSLTPLAWLVPLRMLGEPMVGHNQQEEDLLTLERLSWLSMSAKGPPPSPPLTESEAMSPLGLPWIPFFCNEHDKYYYVSVKGKDIALWYCDGGVVLMNDPTPRLFVPVDK